MSHHNHHYNPTITPQVGTHGNDMLHGTSGRDILLGQGGDDTLSGGNGRDFLSGGEGVDVLTGGEGKDIFAFSDDPFSGGATVTAANGIQVLNKPDKLTDFTIGQDKMLFSRDRLGVNELEFTSGNNNDSFGSGNLIVITENSFANAAAAAKGLANNESITADAGIFVYFNSTLGKARVVFSQDLSDGGPISVIGQLENVTNVNDLSNLTAKDFVLA